MAVSDQDYETALSVIVQRDTDTIQSMLDTLTTVSTAMKTGLDSLTQLRTTSPSGAIQITQVKSQLDSAFQQVQNFSQQLDYLKSSATTTLAQYSAAATPSAGA